MDKRNFLLEIGCEELPAKSLKRLSLALGEQLAAGLADAKLSFQRLQTYATPRRLAVLVHQLDIKQPASEEVKQGPNWKAAFDQDGSPTMACMGFARGCGVAVDQLIRIDTKKGSWVGCRLQKTGDSTLDLLPDIVATAIKRLPTGKTMRWGTGEHSFIRPVHWVILLFGNELVPAQLFGLPSTRETYGHRFHRPEKIYLKQAIDYIDCLQHQGMVVADSDMREQLIRKQISQLPGCQHVSLQAELIDEVTALVEWPVALRAAFDARFLAVPPEALISAMQNHQKCFPVHDIKKNLQAYFICVSNIESKNPQLITKGNERVMHARLSDAEFFYQNDLKTPLVDHLPALRQVVFQQQLGSVFDKTQRVKALAKMLAQDFQQNTADAMRAAELCKCDLRTDMVGEFPELQGIMGDYYARAGGEDATVATAIREHYLPRFAKDTLPESGLGACLAVADRLDTLVGIIGIGKMPTGDKDPFALKRAAAGLLRIIHDKKWVFDIRAWCENAIAQYGSRLSNDHVLSQSTQFILERLRSAWLEQQIDARQINAVLQMGVYECFDLQARLQAVATFSQLPEAAQLSAAHKRINQLLRKQKDQLPEKATVDADRLTEQAEKSLHQALQQQVVKPRSSYTDQLKSLARLQKPVDQFFDHVMVMCEDDALRNNRLALLMQLKNRLSAIADLEALATGV